MRDPHQQYATNSDKQSNKKIEENPVDHLPYISTTLLILGEIGGDNHKIMLHVLSLWWLKQIALFLLPFYIKTVRTSLFFFIFLSRQRLMMFCLYLCSTTKFISLIFFLLSAIVKQRQTKKNGSTSFLKYILLYILFNDGYHLFRYHQRYPTKTACTATATFGGIEEKNILRLRGFRLSFLFQIFVKYKKNIDAPIKP